MIPRLRAALAVFGLLLVFALTAGNAHGDEYEEVVIDNRAGLAMAQRLRARVLPTRAGRRVGGYGYARVELLNPTDKAHNVTMRMTPSMSSGACLYTRSRKIEPETRVTFDLPLLNSRYGMILTFEVDGRWAEDPVHLGSTRGSQRTLSVLHVQATREWDFKKLLESEMRRLGPAGRPVELLYRKPSELPGHWSLLSGFDIVIADSHAFDAELQHVLLRYIAGGGNLVVAPRTRSVEGPLSELKEGEGHYGLGRWIVLSDRGHNSRRWVEKWLRQGAGERVGILSVASRAQAGRLPDSMWLPLQIPGIGEVPTGVFFVLILLFAILVGPVSYIYFRRRRKLPLLLVTVPAAGFLCTAAILGYGFFKEGFGVIGSQRSISVLDQASQFAVSHASRTLYAGLQPSALDPGPDTLLVPTSFAPDERYDESLSYFQVDLDAGFRVDGSVLPSRTATGFVTTSVGRARDRLRFRRRVEGGYDVLASPDFGLALVDRSVLFRHQDGSYYLGSGGVVEKLERLGPWSGGTVADLIDGVSEMRLGPGRIMHGNEWRLRSRFYTESSLLAVAAGTVSLGTWLKHRLEKMPRGSYLARMRRPPLADGLGLDIDYRAEEHLVLGLLGPEDVIDE